MTYARLTAASSGCAQLQVGNQEPVTCCAWRITEHVSGLTEIVSDGHLQFLTSMEADTCLNNLFDALSVDGRCTVRVPDLDQIAKGWLEAEWNEPALRDLGSCARRSFAGLFGWQRGGNPVMADYAPRYDDVHKSGYNVKRLEFLMWRVGFVDVQVVVDGPDVVAIGRKSMRKGERQIATNYDNIRRDHLNRYQFAIAQLHALAPARILDLACGIGYGTKLLAEALGSDVTGVDVDAGAIDYARLHYAHPKVQFLLADARTAIWSENSYDAIVSFETIEHVDFAEELIGKFAFWLKPGGYLVMSTPNQAVMPFDAEKFPFHIRHFTVNEITALVECAGLTVISLHAQPDSNFGDAVSGDDGAFALLIAVKP